MVSSSESVKSTNRNVDVQKPWRVWREPLVHFFILGLAVFALHAVLDRKPEVNSTDPLVVEVTSAEIEWMRTLFTKQMGREPTARELRGQINQLIKEQILSREAVVMGLDQGDVVVRRRLAQKMEFLFKDISSLAEPTEEELQAYFSENQSKYAHPPQVSFTQVYFNTGSRGVDAAAQAVQAVIQASSEPDTAITQGDTSILSPTCKHCSPRQIGDRFGSGFAKHVLTLSPGAWHGPIQSAYGVHAVYIHNRRKAEMPQLKEIRNRVKEDLIGERQDENTRNVYRDIRSRYRVLVEGLPYGLDLKGI